ncbi:PREDICTED: carbonic anhydrase 13-like [Ceratosolen solmsi marchali]|uniref:Carbonic anhydrase 13-like n=1 Tax=Ceratosolen solmsi marchali TaxID=326594 RepID=A0AAJ6YP45_9HYME|nr:PREDICTED: carbonic anhydrase 13-like [Ceratosolen solmsi marchali]
MDIIIFCGSILLFAMLLMELLDWLCLVSSSRCSESSWINPFIYGENNGPRVWRLLYPESRGCEQSPINIDGQCATVVAHSEPLRWQGYCDEPASMVIVNDGNKVILLGVWRSSMRPCLSGGPLKGVYDFCSIEFRWGPANDEGSEHSIDYMRYPMELQVVHTKRSTCTLPGVTTNDRDVVVILSYFFQLTSIDNPYLDHVVTNLWRISNPGCRFTVTAFPLEWLVPSFNTKFYTYSGSITQPPCTENAIWILNPCPIAISAQQISQFRNVCSIEGPILSNSRPVQKLNDRQIFYYT